MTILSFAIYRIRIYGKDKMKITLQQLSAKAGVSLATASRVLNGAGPVATATRERVLQAAAELGYLANCNTAGRPLIALIGGYSLSDYYIQHMLQYLSDELERNSFNAVFICEHNLDVIQNIPVNGAIAISSEGRWIEQWLELKNCPLVGLNIREDVRSNIHSVNADIDDGITLAVNHLHEIGCRRIAMVIPGLSSMADHVRSSAFARAAAGRFDYSAVEFFQSRSVGLPRAFALLRSRGVDGLLVPGYDTGLAAYHALQLINWKVPDEVAVILQLEPEISDFLLPEPTVIRTDLPAMSRRAVSLMMRLIANDPIPAGELIPYQLAVRHSTRRFF